MVHRYRFVFAPRWFVLHVITLGLGVAMVLLGRWQLDVSEAKHFNLRNFAYALQWWAFTAFAVALWIRVIRDGAKAKHDHEPTADPVVAALEHVTPDQVAYRRYVPPTTPPPPADEHHAAYNDYLAALAREDEQYAEGRNA